MTFVLATLSVVLAIMSPWHGNKSELQKRCLGKSPSAVLDMGSKGWTDWFTAHTTLKGKTALREGDDLYEQCMSQHSWETAKTLSARNWKKLTRLSYLMEKRGPIFDQALQTFYKPEKLSGPLSNLAYLDDDGLITCFIGKGKDRYATLDDPTAQERTISTYEKLVRAGFEHRIKVTKKFYGKGINSPADETRMINTSLNASSNMDHEMMALAKSCNPYVRMDVLQFVSIRLSSEKWILDNAEAIRLRQLHSPARSN